MKKRAYIVHLQRLEMPSPTVYVPYVYGILRSYAEQHPDLREAWTFGPPVWRMQSVAEMLARLETPDLVGFSVYVWNFENSLRLARAVKERWPSCRVVFGGPHVSSEPSGFFEAYPFVDACVHGEGEQPLRDLLRELLADSPDLGRVRGISYGVDGCQVFTPPADRLLSLDAPGPYQSGCFDGFMDEIRALSDEMPVQVLASLETTRGCPYACTFCDWGMSTMSKIRQHPVARVRAELDWIAAQGIRTVILNDSNFGIFERDVDIMHHLADLKRRTGFPQAFYPLGFAKNNKERAFRINQIIRDEGFDPSGYNVNFSLQSMSPDALQAIGRQNIKLREARDLYARAGYSLSPDLILPLPGETLASFKEGYAELASWPEVQRIRIYPCTILPNAPMAKPVYREQWGLVTRVSALEPQAGLRVAGDAVEERIETVVATSTMSELDVAEAKLFVSVVDALEISGVLRALRAWVQEVAGVSGGVFYDALMRWQLANDGVMAAAIAGVFAEVVEGSSYTDQIAWSGVSATWDGTRMQRHKVILYDTLTRAERFIGELRAFVGGVFAPHDERGLEGVLAEMVGSWVLPGDDRDGWLRLALAIDEVDCHLLKAA